MTAIPPGGLDRGGVDQPAHRLGQQQERTAGDERGLAQHRQRFGLAMAEAMLAIGRAHGVAHRNQVDDRGKMSMKESIRLDSRATEPVSSQAANLTAISNAATATEA